ncbi:MAG: hypothetical protein GY854_00805 [Deltaproteobacteria bacterium]|nr:hypothetical protein [Deltaproteobacteria bacterium]
MEEPTCVTCMYWMQNIEMPGGQNGWCRRYPPQPLWIDSPNMPIPNAKPDVHSFMPAVHADLWCGEYKFKGSKKSKGKSKGKAKN